MSNLEEKPREAFDTNHAARRRGARLRRLARRRWLVPAAAAVVVLAVIAGFLAVGRAAPGTAPAAAPIQMSIPRYYVALDSNRPPSSFTEPVAYATVRETATGALLARIKPPSPYNSFVAVSGAADDRTFALLAMGPPDPFTETTPERFFLLHIDPTASSAASRVQLAALPESDIPGGNTARYLPLGNQVDTIAISPNGASLAALLTVSESAHKGPDPANGQSYEVTYLYVYDLASGTTRTWLRKCARCQSAELGYSFEDPDLATLSWASNGRSLAFIVGNDATPSQLRVLNVGALGDNVQPNSTPFDMQPRPWSQAVMTPDGKTVFFSYSFSYGPRGRAVSTSLERFSAATGQVTRINTLPMIRTDGHPGGYSFGGVLSRADTILWTNYDGSKVIIADAARGHTAGVYSGVTYTPLPWPANAIGAAW
jgi:hypothetical protein